MSKTIKLANPRGFCAGVDRAIDMVNRALEIYGPPVYVKHEVVHNKIVVNDLKNRGAIFVEEIDEIPNDSLVIFSAHGVSSEVEDTTKARELNFFDATCPLVTKVHMEVKKHAKANKDIILIGHEGHPEVEGTMGRHINSDNSSIYLVQDEQEAQDIYIKNENKLALVTQTTLSVDETKSIIDILKKRFPKIQVPKKDDICYATQNRQDAVKQLSLESDFMIVVGSKNSSNSNRLKELSEKCGCKSVLIDEFSDLNLEDLNNCSNISITAGASAPESKVMEIAKSLEKHFGAKLMEDGEDNENIFFKLPPGLR
jgi:4-hydroxy-3-methylbut-2-enyl diphosphate reductase|tara:strand:- start:126 stop:1064 length:939 start_codon:yes stop_codon:yes gene_type:complete